jgi:hypothetical protein
MSGHKKYIGLPVLEFGLEECASIWDGLQLLGSKTHSLDNAIVTSQCIIESLKEEVQTKVGLLRSQPEDARVKMDQVLNDLTQRLREMGDLIALLNQEHERLTDRIIKMLPLNSTSVNEKLRQLDELRNDVAVMQASQMSQSPRASNGEVEKLKGQLRLLEARIPTMAAGAHWQRGIPVQSRCPTICGEPCPNKCLLLLP